MVSNQDVCTMNKRYFQLLMPWLQNFSLFQFYSVFPFLYLIVFAGVVLIIFVTNSNLNVSIDNEKVKIFFNSDDLIRFFSCEILHKSNDYVYECVYACMSTIYLPQKKKIETRE